MAPGLMDSTLLDTKLPMTPEKLAMMKLGSLGRDFLSAPTTPTHENRHFNFEAHTDGGGGQSRALAARTSRYMSSSTRRQSSFMSSHRHKMSSDLTAQAESKFFALMEFMASASREATSLKDYWSRLMAERESFASERDELLTQIDEVTESMERNQSQHHHHSRELGERRKEVEKLLIELSAAMNGVTEQKKRVADRDQELERSRTELHDLRLSSSRTQLDYDKMKADYESVEAKIRVLEGERDHARNDADKYRSEFRSLTREQTELKGKNIDITTRLDSSKKEVSSLLDRIRSWEREREDYMVEKDRLQEELRKSHLKADESSREVLEITDRHDRLHREIVKIRETIRFAETERDEHVITIERLRHEIKSKTTAADDAEAQYAEIVLKYEKTKREIVSAHDRLRDVEHETTDIRSSLERKTEDYRLIILERDQHKDDLDDERRKVHDSHHTIASLRDQVTRTEATASEIRHEVQTLHERITSITHERDDAREKHHPLNSEISDLKEKIFLVQAELSSMVDHRDRAHKELHEYKRKYEEVTETITDFQSGSGELEYEIESLRTMLREAREQKERAISARTTADRERDEYVSKYEEKCREMERLEESRTSWYREHSHASGQAGGRTTSTRFVTRSSGAMESGHNEHVDGE